MRFIVGDGPQAIQVALELAILASLLATVAIGVSIKRYRLKRQGLFPAKSAFELAAHAA